MTSHIDPSNPEAALLTQKDGRPSLDWIRFAIEELTLFRLDSSIGNGTRAIFFQLAKTAGYSKKEVSDYLGNDEFKWMDSVCSVKMINELKDGQVKEAWAVIEQLILMPESPAWIS